jgi:hypothetical protein
MDWFSRYVLSWELSNTMETDFCSTALQAAFRFGQPAIWNSDQGAQFTSTDFLAPLKKRGVAISMDGRTSARQRVHRTLVAQLEVRTDLPRRLSGRRRTVHRAGIVLPLLQLRAAASGARLSHAGGLVPAQTQEEKCVALMGDAVPQTPWDFPLWTRLAHFALAKFSALRRIELLARRIGQSRDGTRAPSQVRTGGGPKCRLPVTPGHHLTARV